MFESESVFAGQLQTDSKRLAKIDHLRDKFDLRKDRQKDRPTIKG